MKKWLVILSTTIALLLIVLLYLTSDIQRNVNLVNICHDLPQKNELFKDDGKGWSNSSGFFRFKVLEEIPDINLDNVGSKLEVFHEKVGKSLCKYLANNGYEVKPKFTTNLNTKKVYSYPFPKTTSVIWSHFDKGIVIYIISNFVPSVKDKSYFHSTVHICIN